MSLVLTSHPCPFYKDYDDIVRDECWPSHVCWCLMLSLLWSSVWMMLAVVTPPYMTLSPGTWPWSAETPSVASVNSGQWSIWDTYAQWHLANIKGAAIRHSGPHSPHMECWLSHLRLLYHPHISQSHKTTFNNLWPLIGTNIYCQYNKIFHLALVTGAGHNEYISISSLMSGCLAECWRSRIWGQWWMVQLAVSQLFTPTY